MKTTRAEPLSRHCLAIHRTLFVYPSLTLCSLLRTAKLLEFNGGKLPFAAAQIGLAFRNEIAPRSGLLRVREFCLSEIEHFVNPNDKSHPKFSNVANLELQLYPRSAQMGDKRLVPMALGKAVGDGVIANQTLGYYLGRTAQFLWAAGIKKDKLRFRQHLAKEMAHYACDCWDAEILTTYVRRHSGCANPNRAVSHRLLQGWIECVGHADRAAYDLTVHAAESKARLTAFVAYDKPIMKKVLSIKADKGKIGRAFKGAAQNIIKYLEAREESDAKKLQDQLATGCVEFTCCSMVTTSDLHAHPARPRSTLTARSTPSSPPSSSLCSRT